MNGARQVACCKPRMVLLWGYRSGPKSPTRGVYLAGQEMRPLGAWDWLGSLSLGGTDRGRCCHQTWWPQCCHGHELPQRQVKQTFKSSRSMLFLSNASPTEMRSVWSPLSKYLILKEKSTKLVLCPMRKELQFSETFPSLDWCSRVAKAECTVGAG